MKQSLIISKLNTGRQGCHLFPSLGSLVTNSMRKKIMMSVHLILKSPPHLSVHLIKKEER
jgi:hypothetical protein